MHLPVAMGDPAAGAITCFPLQKLTVQQELGPNCMSLGLEERGVRGGVVLSGSPVDQGPPFPDILSTHRDSLLRCGCPMAGLERLSALSTPSPTH